jgi:HSP20 family protein
MDRLFDRFVFRRCVGCSIRNLRSGRQLIPNLSTLAIDMHEDEKPYSISSQLPGIYAKDIDVSVSDGTLVLKGEKTPGEG